MTLPPNVELAAGRYVVRVELTAADRATPLQTITDAYVPAAQWLISGGGLTLRRGPSTGLQYVPTADARFRRTERIRLEVPRSAAVGQASARLVGRDGQAIAVPVTLSERIDVSGVRMLRADLTLAALAQGDYAVEITVEQGDQKEGATYAFRVVP
jgi:hypothetical protein